MRREKRRKKRTMDKKGEIKEKSRGQGKQGEGGGGEERDKGEKKKICFKKKTSMY